MIKNGHSWSSIQQMALGEIGFFLKAVIRAEERESLESYSTMWLANNHSAKGYAEHIKLLQGRYKRLSSPKKTKEQEGKEILDNWKRLAMAMSSAR